MLGLHSQSPPSTGCPQKCTSLPKKSANNDCLRLSILHDNWRLISNLVPPPQATKDTSSAEANCPPETGCLVFARERKKWTIKHWQRMILSKETMFEIQHSFMKQNKYNWAHSQYKVTPFKILKKSLWIALCSYDEPPMPD